MIALFNHMIFRFRVKFSRGQTRETDMRFTSLPSLWNGACEKLPHFVIKWSYTLFQVKQVSFFFPMLAYFPHELKKTKVTQTKLKTGVILSISTATTPYLKFKSDPFHVIILPLPGKFPGRDPTSTLRFRGRKTQQLHVLLPKINHYVSNLIVVQKILNLAKKEHIYKSVVCSEMNRIPLILVHQPGWLWKRVPHIQKYPKIGGWKKNTPQENAFWKVECNSCCFTLKEPKRSPSHIPPTQKKQLIRPSIRSFQPPRWCLQQPRW